jgi:ribosomal protein S18 acetylase RimI-like enzyme
MRLRNLRPADQAEVVRLDALHTGRRKPAYWRRVFEGFVHAGRGAHRVGLAAEQDGRLVGYLIGEVRAFEFGSEPCGWIFAVGVDPACLRRGIASSLLSEARRGFARHGVRTLRTMVRRDDVRLMSFFRSSGFVGGRFLQLEAPMPGKEETP